MSQLASALEDPKKVEALEVIISKAVTTGLTRAQMVTHWVSSGFKAILNSQTRRRMFTGDMQR